MTSVIVLIKHEAVIGIADIDAFADLVAAAFVGGVDRLASLVIDQLLADAIAGDFVDLPEGDALAGGGRRIKRHGTGDEGELQIALPIGTSGGHGNS